MKKTNPTDIQCMDILQTTFFCVRQKQESHKGLEQYDGDCMITAFKNVFGELSCNKVTIIVYAERRPKT